MITAKRASVDLLIRVTIETTRRAKARPGWIPFERVDASDFLFPARRILADREGITVMETIKLSATAQVMAMAMSPKS